MDVRQVASLLLVVLVEVAYFVQKGQQLGLKVPFEFDPNNRSSLLAAVEFLDQVYGRCPSQVRCPRVGEYCRSTCYLLLTS